MVQSKKINLTFCKSNFSEFGDSTKIVKLFDQHIYNNELNFGIKSISKGGDNIDIILIKRTSTFIFEYNADSRDLERRQIFIYQDIDVSFDLLNNVVCIYGSSTNYSTAKIILRKIINSSLQLEPLYTSPYDVYKSILSSDTSVKLEQLTVEQFIYNDGLSGKFDSMVLKQKVAQELIEKFTTDIKKIILRINVSEEDEFLLCINRGGIIGIQSSINYFDENFETTKQIIIL